MSLSKATLLTSCGFKMFINLTLNLLKHRKYLVMEALTRQSLQEGLQQASYLGILELGVPNCNGVAIIFCNSIVHAYFCLCYLVYLDIVFAFFPHPTLLHFHFEHGLLKNKFIVTRSSVFFLHKISKYRELWTGICAALKGHSKGSFEFAFWVSLLES